MLLLFAFIIRAASQSVCTSNECSTSQNAANVCRPGPSPLTPTTNPTTPPAAYSCSCQGKGWKASADRLSCARDPCADNPCASLQDASNLCFPLGNSYTCRCGGVRWSATSDGKNCTEAPNGCAGDPCHTAGDPKNLCNDNNDGTHYCLCGGISWKASSDRTSCLQVIDPCTDDPCSNYLDSANICTQLTNGQYACTCNGVRFQNTLDRLSCSLIPDPCASDPCYNRRDTSNVCIEQVGSAYNCVCGGQRWSPSANATTCVYSPNPCANLPCSEDKNYQNTCVEQAGGTYVCQCKGRGWMVAQNNTACIPVPSACVNYPCSENIAPGNICVDNRDGTYTCSCMQRGWGSGPFGQNCTQPVNLCTVNDPCGTKLGAKNECVDTLDGSYVCLCRTTGWTTSYGSLQCIAPLNKCTASDPCTATGNPGNVCNNNGDGTYTCTCKQPGWTTAISLLRCIAPSKGCLLDPCRTAKMKSNVCTDNTDGTWQCACTNGWVLTLTIAGPYCNPPPNLCAQADVCSNSISPLNYCTDLHNGAYTCTCAGPGWSLANDKQSCIPPLNMCNQTNDPCAAHSSPGNRCVYEGAGQHYCVCNGRGYTTPVGAYSCTPPLNPCNSDPCSTGQSLANAGGQVTTTGTTVTNICINNNDGSYTCACNAVGWTLGAGSLRCIAPPNRCLLGDPCKTAVNRDNRCSDLRNGKYTCSCIARGWNTSTDRQTCIPPLPSCVNPADPCRNLADPKNYCIDNNDGTFYCYCGADYYSQSANKTSCVCMNPCQRSDPCVTALDPGNKCVPNYDNPYAGPNYCGIPICTCNTQAGWNMQVDQFGFQTCAPPDPCSKSDPCSSLIDPGNVCINTFIPPQKIVAIVQSGATWSIPVGPGTQNRAIAASAAAFPSGVPAITNALPNVGVISGPLPVPLRVSSFAPLPIGNRIPTLTTSQAVQAIALPFAAGATSVVTGASLYGTSLYGTSLSGGTLYGSSTTVLNPVGNVIPYSAYPIAVNGIPAGVPLSSAVGFSYREYNPPTSAPTYSPTHAPTRKNTRTTSAPTSPTRAPTLTTRPTMTPTRHPSRTPTRHPTHKETQSPTHTPTRPPTRPPTRSPTAAQRSAAMSEAARTAQTAQNGQSAAPPSLGPRPAAAAAGDTLNFSPNPALRGSAAGPELLARPGNSPNTNFRRQSTDLRRQFVSSDNVGDLTDQFALPGYFVCACGAVGWTTPLGAQYCEPPDPCILGDPCNHLYNPDNICVTGRKDGQKTQSVATLGRAIADYYCLCQGRGWYSSSDSKECYVCNNACAGAIDACSSLEDPSNICVWDFDQFTLPDQYYVTQQNLNPNVAFTQADPGLASTSATAPVQGLLRRQATTDSPTPAQTQPGQPQPQSQPKSSTKSPTKTQPPTQGKSPTQRQSPTQPPSGFRRQAQSVVAPGYTLNPNSNLFPASQTGMGYLSVQIGQCGGYRCSCDNANDWVAPYTADSCIRCTDPCQSDPCSNGIDNNNVCTWNFAQATTIPDIANSITGGNTVNVQSTLRRQNSNVFTQPNLLYPEGYGSQGYSVNSGGAQFVGNYNANSCGTYTCTCGGLGWVAPVNQQSCQQCDDPCDSDPCSNYLSSGNRCYSSVNTANFSASDYVTRRQATVNGYGSAVDPQTGYPLSFYQSECGQYVCACGGRGFIADGSAQSCIACQDPCAAATGDPCQTTKHPLNVCISLTDVTRRQAPPASGTSRTSPVRPASPPPRAVYAVPIGPPTSSPTIRKPRPTTPPPSPAPRSDTASNRAAAPPTATTFPVRTATTVAPTIPAERRQVPIPVLGGVAVPPGTASQAAILSTILGTNQNYGTNPSNPALYGPVQYNPAVAAQWATAYGNPANYYGYGTSSLYSGYPPYSTAYDYDYEPPAVISCGKFQCQCEGTYWKLTADLQGCNPVCVNGCTQGDPCQTQSSAGTNKCKFTPSTDAHSCGTYQCTCGVGYNPTFGSQQCSPIVKNACQKQGDPCLNALNSKNICVLASATSAPTSLSGTVPTPAPTTPGVVYNAGGYFCQCTTGYTQGPQDLSCVYAGGVANNGGDSSATSLANSIVTALATLQGKNPCLLGDLCSNSKDSSNSCTADPYSPLGYHCVCGGQYVPSSTYLSCVLPSAAPPTLPPSVTGGGTGVCSTLRDPCLIIASNQANQCVNDGYSVLGYHCVCSTGYILVANIVCIAAS